MARKLVIVGAGGHGKSIACSVNPQEFELIGFVDDYKTGTVCGKPIFGERLEQVPDYSQCFYIVGIGDCYIRRKWFEAIKSKHLNTANVIDSSAQVSGAASIGEGNFIGKFTVVNAGAVIGDNNIINTMALVEHEAIVQSHTNISTRATLNGDVIVQDGAFVGSGATCIGQIVIGKDAVVGAGSVVIHNVDDGITVAGIPAKPTKGGGGAA